MLKKLMYLFAVLFLFSAVLVCAASAEDTDAENTVVSEYSEYIPAEGEMPPATPQVYEEEEEIDGWIEIDSISDQSPGISKLTVSGYTNLGSECTVYLTITRACEVNEMVREEIWVSTDDERNRWVFEGIDVSWLEPDCYTVNARVMCNGEALAESKTDFEIKKSFIEIDPVEDVNAGDIVTIKGKALIPDSESICVKVFETPYSGDYSSGEKAEMTVTPSSGGEWSASFDTTGYPETGYFVVARLSCGEEFPKGETEFKVWEPVDSLSDIGDCSVGDTVTVSGKLPSVSSGELNIYLVPMAYIPKELLNSNDEPQKSDYEERCIAKKSVYLSEDDRGVFSASFDTTGFPGGEYLVIVDLPSEGCMTGTFTLYGEGESGAYQPDAVSGQAESGENEELKAEIEALRQKLEEKEQVIAEKEAVIEEQKGIIESLMGLLSGFLG